MNLNIDGKDFLSLAEEILSKGDQLVFKARGGSMSPFIRDGDAVILALLRKPPGVGDVILLRTRDDRTLLHRVVRKRNTGVVTQGDASSSDDGFIPFENVVGKVVRISGSGYNFHLKRPFKFLIARRIIYSTGLSRYPLILRFGRKIAEIVG